jgi:cystathionine gamma-lyase
MTHAGISKEEREESGVYDDLVRLSCGIEDTQDLIIDVLHAIKKAVMSTGNGIL